MRQRGARRPTLRMSDARTTDTNVDPLQRGGWRYDCDAHVLTS